MGKLKIKRLAIIIPAYKKKFLDRTLFSISKMDLTYANVYIFNDNSPYDIESICIPYVKKHNFIYKKYEENIGKHNLVSQWNRCVESTTEEWIWLFSDDDLADDNIVTNFFNALKETKEYYDVYRFNTVIIDTSNRIITKNPKHPKKESAVDFIISKLRLKRKSFVCEYIFRRKVFNTNCGFISFPLAWCSDDASWFTFSQNTGIYTIQEGYVYWRLSNENISSVSKNKKIEMFEASNKFISYLSNKTKNENIDIKKLFKIWYIHQYFYIFGKSLKNTKYLCRKYEARWDSSFLDYIVNIMRYIIIKFNRICI